MCGIAGYMKGEGGAPEAWARRMCDRLAYRGPDAEGYYTDADVTLGHRRLSIIDIAGGDQPLGNEDGSVQVVFNGEIYNYRELRQDLAARGHCFRTRSDTEVLVHLYEEVGAALPEHLNGMFAFALWDARRKELLLGRDRLGKKPLYYSLAIPGFRVCFASELKALTALPRFAARVNRRAVADFLALSYVPEPQTIYENVFKLEAAHTLRISASRTEMRRYWAPEFAPDVPANLESAGHQLADLAKDAVERRMISDVPLGVFLSGGIDSSAVLGLMARLAGEKIKSFSIGFTSQDFDEIWYARLAATHNRSDHHEHVVSPSAHEVLDELVDYFDEPFGDPSALPMLCLARMARRHVTVALTGDGADELFGGYRRYYFGVLEQKVRDRFPAWFRHSAFRLGARWYPKFDYLPRVFRAKTMLANLAQELADAYFTSMSAFRDDGLQRLLASPVRRSLAGYSPRQDFRRRFDAYRELSPLRQLQAVDLQTYLPGDILVKADRTTMRHGLEARAPWLDYRIAEFSFQLPPSFLLRGRTGKYIFRRALAPYVPPVLLTRRKMGFSVPLAEWLRTSLRATFEERVLREELGEWISLAEARRIWAEHQSRLRNHDRKLWNLLMLACWAGRHHPGAAWRDSASESAGPAVANSSHATA